MTTGVSYMMPVMLCISKYMWLMFYFPVFILSGAFTKLRKASLSFAMSVRMEVGSHWTDFHDIPYLIFFNIPTKFKFHKNLAGIVGTLLNGQCTFMMTSG
jgi:uncharacterized membrane protein YphA (DoxX/SURF4 family)